MTNIFNDFKDLSVFETFCEHKKCNKINVLSVLSTLFFKHPLKISRISDDWPILKQHAIFYRAIINTIILLVYPTYEQFLGKTVLQTTIISSSYSYYTHCSKLWPRPACPPPSPGLPQKRHIGHPCHGGSSCTWLQGKGRSTGLCYLSKHTDIITNFYFCAHVGGLREYPLAEHFFIK